MHLKNYSIEKQQISSSILDLPEMILLPDHTKKNIKVFQGCIRK
jgi:hypothetical protein